MKKHRRRNCLHCGELYHPDSRTKHRQRHCSKSECKKASKRRSQQIWLTKPANRDYFKGPEQVERNRAWRKAHPCYWKKPRLPKDALQDELHAQSIDEQRDKTCLIFDALQDEISTQPIVLLGLISTLAGSALQDDMVPFIHKMHARGQQILGNVPGSQPQGTHEYTQTTPSTRPPAPGASAVQLARSPPGP